ncbi:MAG: group II intron reverse transcriptase domain-containing protein [Candidatus Vogelbacteria bacterium]|nr:group II intron reverse transcriptase domain-containing protein [Candidatus Vogelbacteria bacterium]
MTRKIFHLSYDHIISPENLLGAWREFIHGKRHKRDVQEFHFRLMDNLLSLQRDLQNQTYCHGPYQHFRIHDPKPRDIHKASVRDRLVHHAIYRALYWFYHQVFISDSYSCRLGKGTLRAINRFRGLAYEVSQNHTRTCWVLKCDIRKFFASIDQATLLSILRERITDQDILWLLEQVIGSFHSMQNGVGLPLGNLTSQLFVNVYLNEFDQFMKRELKVKHYLRYADDFVLLSDDCSWLENQLPLIDQFLTEKLKLALHPDKIVLKTISSGLDFLGWVHFTDHRVLRTMMRRRMLARLKGNQSPETLNSYLGLIRHGNTYKLEGKLWKNLSFIPTAGRGGIRVRPAPAPLSLTAPARY